jgi:hypothetical protein
MLVTQKRNPDLVEENFLYFIFVNKTNVVNVKNVCGRRVKVRGNLWQRTQLHP